MKTYCIFGSDGEPKPSWEEVNCDSISINGTVVTFYSGKFIDMKIDIIYNLGPGEALVYVSES